MAAVDRTLSVRDGFSAILDRYVKKLEGSIAAAEQMVTAEDRLSDAMANVGMSDDGIQRWVAALENAQYKTLAAKDSLENMIASLKEFAAEGGSLEDMNRVLEIIDSELKAQGYAWSETADQFDRYALLTENGIPKLVQKGLLLEKTVKDVKDATEKAGSAADESSKRFDGFFKSMERGGAASGLLGGVTRRLIGMALSFVSVYKLLNYFKAAAGRAPDEIQKKFAALKETTSNFFAGTTAAAMEKMVAGVERLNAAFNSPAGQKFARGMEAIGRVVGEVVSFAFEKLAVFVEWIGDHMEPVAIAAGIAFALWAVHMLALAAATAAANAPLLLLIGLAAGFAATLVNMGFTAEEVFGYIGAGLYTLYAFGYNLVADVYNVYAALIEFISNASKNFWNEAEILVISWVDTILAALERVAKAADALFGWQIADKVAALRDGLNLRAEELKAAVEGRVTVDRLTPLDYTSMWEKGMAKGESIGAGLSDYALKTAQAQDIKSIAQNTSAIKDAVTDEDITALVDMAERAFVNQVNLTAQTPVITINGANTGNTEADRQNLARAIRDILVDQLASAPVTPSAYYTGG